MRRRIATIAAVSWMLTAALTLGEPPDDRVRPHDARRRDAGDDHPRPHGRAWRDAGPGVYPYYLYPGYGWPYYPPGYGPVTYLPPVWMPAERLYGPQAVQRFMGVGPAPGVASGVKVVAVLEDDEEEPKKPNLRATNAKAVDLARRFIGYGDVHFGKQRFVDANQRYRKATQAAPQLAEARFRHAWALIALGRYDAAAAALKRGLGLDPDWPKSTFKVDDLYGPNRLAKKAHLDVLAKEAGQQPESADLLFLVGVFLHFDGQPQRAKVFFQRAAQLAAGDDAHIRAFK